MWYFYLSILLVLDFLCFYPVDFANSLWFLSLYGTSSGMAFFSMVRFLTLEISLSKRRNHIYTDIPWVVYERESTQNPWYTFSKDLFFNAL